MVTCCSFLLGVLSSTCALQSPAINAIIHNRLLHEKAWPVLTSSAAASHPALLVALQGDPTFRFNFQLRSTQQYSGCRCLGEFQNVHRHCCVQSRRSDISALAVQTSAWHLDSSMVGPKLFRLDTSCVRSNKCHLRHYACVSLETYFSRDICHALLNEHHLLARAKTGQHLERSAKDVGLVIASVDHKFNLEVRCANF